MEPNLLFQIGENIIKKFEIRDILTNILQMVGTKPAFLADYRSLGEEL